jgi:hypothetical protein
LKDVLSHLLIRVCKNLKNLVAINEECPQKKKKKNLPKGKFFDKVIKINSSFYTPKFIETMISYVGLNLIPQKM